MHPITVLLVDDERDYLDLSAKRLSLRGFAVSVASSGHDALELARRRAFDVAVLDVKMPGMDGLECLRQLRQLHPHMQAILLTGHADLSETSQGFALGAFEYLIKPVHIDELVESLLNACSCGKQTCPPHANEHDRG